MTEYETNDETRQALAAVHSPKLDTLRAAIPKICTSILLGLIINTDALLERLDEDGLYDPKSGWPKHKYTEEQEGLIIAAAILAIGDELDRRIPA